MHFRWLAFTFACVGTLIALGILAVDERNVVWEGRKPHCPHCRADVRMHALSCGECTKNFDWYATKESCQWCLNEEDAQALRNGFDRLGEIRDGDMPTSLAGFPKAYFLAMEEGNCGYCAGLGRVTEAGAEVVCPVCRGDEDCVACAGDREVVVGDSGAHRVLLERMRLWREGIRREALTRQSLRRNLLVDEDVEALRGYAEAENLSDETRDRLLLGAARRRLEKAFAGLSEAVNRTQKPAPGTD